MSGALFVASNAIIMLGYVFLAAFVVPKSTARLRMTRIGGVGFFTTCGLHHLDNLLHYVLTPDLPVADAMTELHMLVVDVPQAVFVWMFVIGLYVELVRWGPWSAGTTQAPTVGEELASDAQSR